MLTIETDMKRVAGVRVDDDIYNRLEALAAEDRRSVSNVIELCIVRHLPEMEREVLGFSPTEAEPEVTA